MLLNYIKIAIKVMLRKKFFTCVSIFGISFTIMIVSIGTGIFVLIFDNSPPTVNHDRTLYFDGYTLTNNTSLQNRDSSLFTEIRKNSLVKNLSTNLVKNISLFNGDHEKLFKAAFTDQELFNIYSFTFLEGRPFTQKDVDEGQSFAVITESVKKYYFGSEPAVGKFIGNNPQLRVIGVIKDFISVIGSDVESSNIFIPITRYSSNNQVKDVAFSAVILAQSRGDIPQIKNDILTILRRRYPPSDGEIYLDATTIYEKMNFQASVKYFAAFIFFILIIPTLNLIGLNVNRIAERSSEIGIRKAFGASSMSLIGQFLIENIFITFLGGIIGILLTFAGSQLVIQVIYLNKEFVPSGNFLLNWTGIGYVLIISLIFGFLSGILPAYRMSKLDVVKALKGINK